MLHIVVPESEVFKPDTNEFILVSRTELNLEHSLVSISKWESKYCKPFFKKDGKSTEELLYYIKCMTLNQKGSDDVYYALTSQNIKEITEYINSPMTATTFSDSSNGRPSREIITSEVIYYQMIALGIPFECQKWHINRLLTLIKVCNIKNGPQKKMSKAEILSRNASLNAARRAAMNSKG